MKNLAKAKQADWDLVPVNPDPGFDPEHNRKVIAETLRKNELNKKKRMEQYHEVTDGRAEEAGYYLRGIDQGGRSTDINKYFGKSYMARVRGEQIRDMLYADMTEEQLIKGLKDAKKEA